MVGNDGVYDGEAQSGPLFFSREIGLKNPREEFTGNPVALVGNRDREYRGLVLKYVLVEKVCVRTAGKRIEFDWLVVAGGNPGIGALLSCKLENPYTVIVLTNLDPYVVMQTGRMIRRTLAAVRQ